jgi:hypothetical protein
MARSENREDSNLGRNQVRSVLPGDERGDTVQRFTGQA